MALLRLFDPTIQFQTKSGALNVAGKLRVYVENTDDLANIYGDDGSLLSQPLILDSNGRARGLFVDSGHSYRLEVYDRNDSLLFTIRRLEPNVLEPNSLDKVAVESGAVAGFLKDVLVSASDMLTFVPSGNQLKANFNLILPSDVVRDSAYTHIDAATANPLMNGTAAAGVSTKYAREDHVHPSDTSREDIANKTTVVLGTSDSKYPTDKAVAEFVNSSIATNTANYISNNGEPFTSVEQLEAYSGTVTNNDYAFVTGIDSEGNTYYDRYKATVSGSTVTWALEYRLNNSSFTAAQWSAINSGITSVLVAKIHDHSNKDVLDGITSDKVNSWDGKEDAFEVLATTKGGTGTNAASKSALTSSLINSLSTELSTPVDADYYVAQYQNGGTSNTSFVRRPVSALWTYIKSKISSVLGLTDSAYSGKAATAGTADKAVADNSGNDIETTYATKTELATKQNKLTAGSGITISNSTISALNRLIPVDISTNEKKDFNSLPGDNILYYKNSSTIFANQPEKTSLRFIQWSSPNYYSVQLAISNTKKIYIRVSNPNSNNDGKVWGDWTSFAKTNELNEVNSSFNTHKNDTTVHITAAERNAWNAKQSALTAGDRITIDGNTIIADSQVFYATYGVTKYSEASEAINNGKYVFSVYGNNIGQLVYFGSEQIIFAKTNYSNNLITLYLLWSSDSWTKKDRTYNEQLTFDATPTAGSTNPVTSKGIKAAIDNVQTNIDAVDAKGIVINEIDGENVICFE